LTEPPPAPAGRREALSRLRPDALLLISLVSVFLLQPATTIRHLSFWLPVASLSLTVLAWAATRSKSPIDGPGTRKTASIMASVVLAIGLSRYLGDGTWLIAARPPAILPILVGLALILFLAVVLLRVGGSHAGIALLAAGLILFLFVILKTSPLALGASRWLRSLSGQEVGLASASDLTWLGFSYIAFRLLHVLRDHARGALPQVSLQEFVTYTLFFPSLLAGPIDRIERFVRDLREPKRGARDLSDGVRRIMAGLFKKIVLADSLALISLGPSNVSQVHSAGWTMILLYAYSFRLYLDFSGYTDIAVGVARLVGVHLPENFDRPYLKPTPVAFWNSWHITLAQWFRSYYFNPLTRALRQSRLRLPDTFVVLVGQVSTMVLIGLWHAVAWNFVVWGIWHGLGLFIVNRVNVLLRGRRWVGRLASGHSQVVQTVGVLLTFHFVTLGWIWFALPDVRLGVRVFLRLVGL
ncbi:MAG TPA: MBOAT family O-acyltransferase, partial [Thermoleophilia bacterium]|nr:MBOAT family O-acyltransferase [Thermoleophilia bacterium]